MRSIFFTEKFNREQISNSFTTGKKIVILSVLLVTVTMFFVFKHSNDKIDIAVQNYDNDTLSVADYGDAATGDDVEIVYNNAPRENTSSATPSTAILIEDTGRADPFLPEGEINITNAINKMNKPKPSYELLPPPETITNDTTATEIMTTKVSGLMYDKTSPSAIININNSDYLVRKGDVVNDYKVLDIDNKSVTVKYGANVYKAGVGELFTGNGINYNTISNLENKFGGNGNSVKK